jgi:hypothetical protein
VHNQIGLLFSIKCSVTRLQRVSVTVVFSCLGVQTLRARQDFNRSTSTLTFWPSISDSLHVNVQEFWTLNGHLTRWKLHKCSKRRSINDAGWSSLVARRAHNPKVVSSNLTPATNLTDLPGLLGLHQEALLSFGKDLGKKSLFPHLFLAIRFRIIHPISLRLLVRPL